MSQAILADPAVEVVIEGGAVIAESPTWVADEGALYWVDIKAPALYRLDLASGDRETWALPGHVGAFALLEGAPAAIVALRHGLFRLDLADGGLDRLAPPPFDPALFRFNEGIVDPTGRFWFGVMFDPLVEASASGRRGALCSYSRAEGLRQHPDLAQTHNGMAFAPGDRHLMIAHSDEGTIRRFPIDAGNGSLGEGVDYATIDATLGVPDGAAMDAEGCYWSAVYGGGRLRRFTPDGVVDREILLPVERPTMCCFAGDRLDTLYVTSASEGMSEAERRADPLAGSVLRLDPGVRGHPKRVYCR